MSWLRHQFSIAWRTLRLLGGQPIASLLNLLVIGIALALPVGFYIAVDNLDKFSRQISSEPQLSLFMALDASPTETQSVERRLKTMAGIKRYEFVPRGAALENLKRNSGLKDVLENLRGNPLPDAFIIVAESGQPEALEALRDAALKWPRVAHVQLDSDWARRLDAALGLGRTVITLLTVLLAAGLVAVTFNTIRLQILTRHEEIEVSRLIGATDSFIRRPFLYFGAIQGLLGGMAAGLIVLVSVWLLNQGLGRLGLAYGAELRVDPLSIADMLSLLLFSAVLGWLGAWMSVSQHLWKSQPQ
jgi:cell division transport system permease protein